MSAYDCVERISRTHLLDKDLKYCFVRQDKRPVKINGEFARPNKIEDFVEFSDLLHCNEIYNYAGVGISIQASDICAIDIDHCFSTANDVSTISQNAKQILEKFKTFAYCEFSFSGTGLRILFRHSVIKNYSDNYYIKNEKNQVEYYQPSQSYRYVTLTGKFIYDNDFDVFYNIDETLFWFLNTFMKKPESTGIKINVINDAHLSVEEIMPKVKYLYLTNSFFQDLWFSKAPGSGKDESERDFKILLYLYENITQNKELLRQLFEQSPFYKSKDFKHINKWTYQNFRYFEYIYDQLNRRVICI